MIKRRKLTKSTGRRYRKIKALEGRPGVLISSPSKTRRLLKTAVANNLYVTITPHTREKGIKKDNAYHCPYYNFSFSHCCYYRKSQFNLGSPTSKLKCTIHISCIFVIIQLLFCINLYNLTLLRCRLLYRGNLLLGRNLRRGLLRN